MSLALRAGSAALLLSACTGAPAPQSAPASLSLEEVAPAPTVPGQVALFDLRQEGPTAWNPSLQGPLPPNAKLPEEEAVLSALFPRRLRALTRCTGDALGSPEDGLIAPEILQVEAGSFSRPGAAELVYLIDLNPCNQTSTTAPQTLLAIFADGVLVAKHKAESAYEIGNLIDLDQDQQHELLLGTGLWHADGAEYRYRIVDLHNGALRTRHDFGVVLRDRCDREDDSGSQLVSAVRFVPGAAPRFWRENYRAACSEDDPFRLTSLDKPLD